MHVFCSLFCSHALVKVKIILNFPLTCVYSFSEISVCYVLLFTAIRRTNYIGLSFFIWGDFNVPSMVKYFSYDIFVVSIFTLLEMLLLAPWGLSFKPEPGLIKIEKNAQSRNPGLQFVRASLGGSEKLKCKLSKSKSSKHLHNNEIYEINWEYKRCGYDLDLIPCESSDNIPWKPFMCKNHKNQTKPCENSSLTLKNLTKRDSGLYRCNFKNYMSKEFIRSEQFLLDVIDQTAEADVRLVEEEPHLDNQIVNINDTALFRCRVRSLSLVSIMWARSATEESKIEKLVRFPNQSFEFLVTAQTVKVNKDTYVSKLEIPSCQMSHSGYYHCVVIPVYNANGVKFVKSVSLTVLDKAVPNLLWVLIVIPILLLIIAAYACFIKITCKFKTEDPLSQKLTSCS